MDAKLTVDQKINVDGKTYRVNGIDTYKLTNIYEGVREWKSYTLINTENENERIWLGYGFADNYFIKQWLIEEEEFRNKTEKLPLNADYTGIANITFEGDQGYSVPHSELVWYNHTNDQHDFIVVERFLEKEGETLKTSKSYYHLMKILKDLKVE